VRIVLLNETFTRNMGYAENALPRAIARLGPEVHVIAANLQAYFDHPDYKEIYEPFNGPAIVPVGVEQLNGFTLHRLPHRLVFGRAQFVGLAKRLTEIRPDIVQTFAVASWDAMQAALAKPRLGYKMFTGAHQHASVFPRALRDGGDLFARAKSAVRRAVPGHMVSLVTERCFAVTPDCGEIASRFYGVPCAQVEIAPMGVDTDAFHPAANIGEREAALARRRALRVQPDTLVCVYSGRFTPEKNPLCLGQAVARLRDRGRPFSAVFIGSGPQREAIAALPGCIVHPFVPFPDLPDFYRAADIGVWPTQESVSMLDAAACGLPIVVSDRLVARERVDGSGLQYRESDADDLAATLERLEDAALRRRLGEADARTMADDFSWDAVARKRLQFYRAALHANGRRSSAP